MHFGTLESGVSQACRRVGQKKEKVKKLKKWIDGLEKKIGVSRKEIYNPHDLRFMV